MLSQITAIRMGFRFRYELIDKFADLDWEGLSPNERQNNISEFQTILQNLLAESDARGNVDVSERNFYSAFDRISAPRMRRLIATGADLRGIDTDSGHFWVTPKISRILQPRYQTFPRCARRAPFSEPRVPVAVL